MKYRRRCGSEEQRAKADKEGEQRLQANSKHRYHGRNQVVRSGDGSRWRSTKSISISAPQRRARLSPAGRGQRVLSEVEERNEVACEHAHQCAHCYLRGGAGRGGTARKSTQGNQISLLHSPCMLAAARPVLRRSTAATAKAEARCRALQAPSAPAAVQQSQQCSAGRRPGMPRGPTCSGVCPSVSLSTPAELDTGWSGGSSVMIMLSTLACLPACSRTPLASYIT